MHKSAEGWTLQRCAGTNKIWHLTLLLFTIGVREVWGHQSSPLLSMYSKWFFSGGIRREREWWIETEGERKTIKGSMITCTCRHRVCLLPGPTRGEQWIHSGPPRHSSPRSWWLKSPLMPGAPYLLHLPLPLSQHNLTQDLSPTSSSSSSSFTWVFAPCLWGASETDLEGEKKKGTDEHQPLPWWRWEKETTWGSVWS